MRNLILAGAFAILAIPAVTSAQTTGTPPADPTGSNTASANLPPATGPNSTMDAPAPAPSSMPSTPAPDTSATAGNAPNASPPADGGMKTYPVCTRQVHDECRNRGGK
jgi:hypothetical protein